MLFVNLSPVEEKSHSYMCARLQQTINKMSIARKTIEEVANSSFDKSFAKCLLLVTCESLQCETEMRSQINTLCYAQLEVEPNEPVINSMPSRSIKSVNSLCRYLENNYVKPYSKLLKDKYLNVSLKELIKYHHQLFLSAITQVKLFTDVKPSVNNLFFTLN